MRWDRFHAPGDDDVRRVIECQNAYPGIFRFIPGSCGRVWLQRGGPFATDQYVLEVSGLFSFDKYHSTLVYSSVSKVRDIPTRGWQLS